MHFSIRFYLSSIRADFDPDIMGQQALGYCTDTMSLMDLKNEKYQENAMSGDMTDFN